MLLIHNKNSVCIVIELNSRVYRAQYTAYPPPPNTPRLDFARPHKRAQV